MQLSIFDLFLYKNKELKQLSLDLIKNLFLIK